MSGESGTAWCGGEAYGQYMDNVQPNSRNEVPAVTDASNVDPTDLLRAMLAITPEDAASAREDAAKAMKPGEQPKR